MENIQYKSEVAANFLRALALQKGVNLNATQVQKLLYMAYGLFLAEGRKIIDEQPKAWPFGPVFPRAQKKVNYNEPIDLASPELSQIIQDSPLKQMFINLIEKFGNITATKLSNWSHEIGGPWYQTTKKDGFNWNIPIDDELITSYFRK